VGYLRYMDYEPVGRGHFLPRKAYQKGWAIDDQVELHVVGKPGSKPVGTRSVGVIKRMYRRYRPDGTATDDIEWSLGHVESAIRPLFDSIEGKWPLNQKDKGLVAEFFSLQMVRGPKWQGEYEKYVHQMLEIGRIGGMTKEELAWGEDERLSTTERNAAMLSQGGMLLPVLGSMSWTLLHFEEPIIALSDHPVVLWSFVENGPVMPSGLPTEDVLRSLEVLAPVTAHLVIVMTWIPDDDLPEIVEGRISDAEAINALVIRQAKNQWIHKIGAVSPIASGELHPISPSLYRGYDAGIARESPLRAMIEAEAGARRTTKERFPKNVRVVTATGGRKLLSLQIRS